MSEQTPSRQPNPYRPGFNQAPLVFAGRDDILDAAGEALEVAAFDGRTPRPIVLVGPRGVGKTVTLGEIAQAAATRFSWPTVHVEAKGDQMLPELIAKLQVAEKLFHGEAPKGRTKTHSKITSTKVEAQVIGIGGGVEIEWEAEHVDSTLGQQFRTTMAATVKRDSGLLLTLDELQNSSAAEILELGGVLQENVPEGWPLVVVIAALPSLRGNRGRTLPTYLERAEWHALETLPTVDAREALSGPAAQSGRPMSEACVDALLELSGGYPYAIQVAGHFAWRASHGSPTITLAHAKKATPRIVADLAQLFQSRWDDASPKEREYLAALADVEDSITLPTGGDVARKLHKRASAVSYLRDRLIKKGTIYRDAAGGLRFITPGMGDWIRRATDPR